MDLQVQEPVQEQLEVSQPAITQTEEAPLVTVGMLAEQPESVPDKFANQSVDKFVKSYTEMEKEYSKTKAQMKDMEERAKRVEALEAELTRQQNQFQQHANQYTQTQNNIPVQNNKDEFKELWEQDPGLAVKQGLQNIERKVEAKFQEDQFFKAYNEMKSTIPDFAELEPVMTQLAPEVKGLFREEALLSPATLRALYLAAKGYTADQRNKAAVSRGMEEASKLQREKNAVMSEGPTSSAPAVNPANLSLDQLRSYLIENGIAKPG